MEGDCFNFSVALHRLYKLPMVVLYGRRIGKDKWGEEFDHDICIHTLSLYKGGTIDFEGFKGEPQQVLAYYMIINEEYDDTDILDFFDEESFWRFVGVCGGAKREEAIAKATEIILQDPKFDSLKA